MLVPAWEIFISSLESSDLNLHISNFKMCICNEMYIHLERHIKPEVLALKSTWQQVIAFVN
jgi:hypothetical protein